LRLRQLGVLTEARRNDLRSNPPHKFFSERGRPVLRWLRTLACIVSGSLCRIFKYFSEGCRKHSLPFVLGSRNKIRPRGNTMSFPITSLYAVPLAVILFLLTVDIIRTRVALRVSIGDGGSTALHERIRRHGNFMEWVPLTLIFMSFAEAQGVAGTWLHSAGILMLAARVIHPIGLRADQPLNLLRAAGATANLVAICVVAAALALKTFG
jgi:uncharacterized protein